MRSCMQTHKQTNGQGGMNAQTVQISASRNVCIDKMQKVIAKLFKSAYAVTVCIIDATTTLQENQRNQDRRLWVTAHCNCNQSQL